LHFPTKGLPSIVGDRVTDGTHRLNKKIYSSLQTQRYTLDEGVLSQKGISIKPRLNKLNFCRSRGGSEPSLQFVLELFHLDVFGCVGFPLSIHIRKDIIKKHNVLPWE